ncbi:hypothetical protein ON010_g16776 [Phytophthora cinnamomi]|nr:hypothetical protein ON010_g16776 [Phytophthora cinnamomi]
MSQSNSRIRKVLHHLNVEYSMPYVNANETQREAGEFHLLEEEQEASRSRSKDASGGGVIAPVTRAAPTQENMHGADSLLLFHGHDSVHGLYEFLINRAPMSNQDVPELYALHPFANATIQSLQVTSHGRVGGVATGSLSEDQSSRTATLFRTEVLGFCFPSSIEKLLGQLKDEWEAAKTSDVTCSADSEVALRTYMEAVSGAERLNAARLDEQTAVGEKRGDLQQRQKRQDELEFSKRRVEAVVVTKLESSYVVETTTRPIRGKAVNMSRSFAGRLASLVYSVDVTAGTQESAASRTAHSTEIERAATGRRGLGASETQDGHLRLPPRVQQQRSASIGSSSATYSPVSTQLSHTTAKFQAASSPDATAAAAAAMDANKIATAFTSASDPRTLQQLSFAVLLGFAEFFQQRLPLDRFETDVSGLSRSAGPIDDRAGYLPASVAHLVSKLLTAELFESAHARAVLEALLVCSEFGVQQADSEARRTVRRTLSAGLHTCVRAGSTCASGPRGAPIHCIMAAETSTTTAAAAMAAENTLKEDADPLSAAAAAAHGQLAPASLAQFPLMFLGDFPSQQQLSPSERKRSWGGEAQLTTGSAGGKRNRIDRAEPAAGHCRFTPQQRGPWGSSRGLASSSSAGCADVGRAACAAPSACAGGRRWRWSTSSSSRSARTSSARATSAT